MRVRRLSRHEDADKEIVWFGSYGCNSDGSAKWFNSNDKHDNFAEKQEYTADVLTQKLNIIRNELWWNVTYGLPLLNKLISKSSIDAAIIEIVLAQDEVEDIISLTSSLNKHKYSAEIKIKTIYGDIQIVI